MARNLTALFMAPKTWIKGGKTFTATPAEQAFQRDLTERFAGLVDHATKGQVRMEIHLADTSIPYNFDTEQYSPTTEGNQLSIHSGAADTYRKQFNADAYGLRVFIGARSMLSRGSGDSHVNMTWGNWIYINGEASSDYVGKVHTDTPDVLLHEVGHWLQGHMSRANIAIPNPDEAGNYGYVVSATLGWTAYLDAIWNNEIAANAQRYPGHPTGAIRWELVPNQIPLWMERTVHLVPFKPVTPGVSWTSSSYVAPTAPVVRPPRTRT